MKLLKLRVKNFATFLEEEIDFTKFKYPIFVEGRTGAGKTTFFVDAITAALYGKAYESNLQASAKLGVMEGKPRCEVALEFELGDKIYRIERRFSRDGGAHDARLYEFDRERGDYIVVGYTPRNVEKFLEDMIGLDYNTMLNSSIVRQGDVHKFIDAKDSEKRNMLVELFNLKRFEDYRKRADEKLRELENQRSRIRGILDVYKRDLDKIPILKSRLDKLKRELPKVEEEINVVDEKLAKLKSFIDEKLAELNDLKTRLGVLNALEKQYENDFRRLKDLERDLEEAKNFLQRFGVKKVDELEGAERDFSNLRILRERLNSLEEKIKQMKFFEKKFDQYKRLGEELKSLKDVEEKVEELRARKDSLNQEIGSISSKISENMEHLEALKRGVGVCPVCGRPISEELRSNRIEFLENEIKVLKSKKAELEAELSKVKKLLNIYENKLSDLRGKEKVYNNLHRELVRSNYREGIVAELEEEARRILIEIGEVENRLMELFKVESVEEIEKLLREIEAKKDKIRSIGSLEREVKLIKDRLSDFEKKLADKDVILDRIKYIEGEIEKLRGEEKSLRDRRDALIGRRGEIISSIENIERELSELERKKAEVKKLEEKLKEISLDIEALTILKKKVFHESALPLKLLKDYIAYLEHYTNEYLREFDQDIEVSLKYVEDRRGGRIQLDLYSSGYKRSIETFSGGEKTLIGFAVRLAIGRLLAELHSRTKRPRFLIIDEGFGPLDEELRLKIVNALKTLMESGEYEQIIVISHQRELRESPIFHETIRVVKEGGVSRIIRESPISVPGQ